MVFRTASGLSRGPLFVTSIALVCSSVLGVQAAYATGDPNVAPAPKTPLQPPAGSVAAASLAGYLPGTAGVTPTGAFTYTLPLDVPAGRAGMAPRLSLNYSSAAGDGPLGQGWSVSGAGSSITRCGKAPEVEGTRTGIRYDKDDMFCLDGQKLIGGGLAETNESGEYGGHYTRYRELQGAFSDIISINPSHDLDAGPDRFIVYGKDGRIREYTPHSAKQTEESTSLVKSKAIGGGVVLSTASPKQYSRNEKNPRVAWLLSSEKDRSGNEVRYSYYELGVITGAGIEFLIKRIDYTYGPNTDAARYVEFEYELRPDKSFSYVTGVRYGHNWRLAHIRMYAPNPVTTGLVYAYHLGYLPTGPNLFDRKRSLLASVQKCGEKAGCLPTRKFNWPTHTLPSFGNTSIEDVTIDTSYDQDPPGAHVLDLDGDGLDDLVYNPGGNDSGETARLGTRNTAGVASPLADARPLNGVGDWPELNGGDTGSLPNINLGMSRPVDLKSDGLVEFMLRDRRWTQPPWNYGEFDNKDTILRWDARDHRFVSTGTRFDTTWLGETDYVDLNGDGLLDHFASPLTDRDFPSFDQFWSFRLQSGNGSFGPATVVGDGFYEYPGNCPGARTFDVDGDGRGNLVFDDGDPEFLNCGRNQLRRVDVADDGTHSITENEPPLAPGGEDYEDGYTQEDSVILPPLRHQNYASVGGTTLKENGLWRWISTLGDFNGDGLLDAVLLPRYAPGPFATWYRGLVLWNTGTGLYWDGSRLDLPHDDLGDLRVGDMNGDGRDDLVSFYHTGLTIDTHDSTTAADDEIVYSGGAQRVSVLLSNGDGTFVDDPFTDLTAGTPRADVGRPLSQLGDFNGDGRLDLVAAGNGELAVMLQNEPAYGSSVQDRIVSVEDEGAASGRYGVVYSNQWTDHPENMGGTCVLPLLCVRRGMPVVRRLISYEQTFAPGDQSVSTYYSYHDPVVHPTQGFLGFGTTRVWAPSRPVEIVTTYDVRSSAGDGGRFFPFGSLPKTITTTVPVLSLAEAANHPTSVTGARIIKTTYTHAFRYLTNTSGPIEVQGDFAVLPSRVHTAEWNTAATIDWSTSLAGPTKPIEHIAEYQGAEPASPGRITDEMVTFDDYGNMTKHHSVTNGGVTEDVSTEFDNSTTAHFDWLISMAKRQQVTRTEPTIMNNGFETNLRGWSATPGLVSIDPSFAHSGVSGVRLSPPRPEFPNDPLDTLVTQRFTVPSDSGTLSFWYKPSCGRAGDYAQVTLQDETAQSTIEALAPVCATADWTKVSAPVTPGHKYFITFRNHSASAAGATNATLVDDVLLSGASTQVTRTVDNTFDDLGRLRKTEVEKGTVDTNQSTSYDLDALGVPTKVTTSTASALNLPDRVTHIEYTPVFSKDVNGVAVFQPDERIYPSQLWSAHDLVVNGQHDPVSYRPSVWQAVHPAFGATVATEDINGAKTSTEWDDLGRPVKITADRAPTTHLSYGTSTDANGKVNGTRTTTTIDTGVADPTKKNTTVVVADQLGRARQTLTTGFDGSTIKADTGYDVLGRATSRSGPYTASKLRETLNFYDSLDRPIQTILPHPTGSLYDLTWQYPDFLVTTATDQRGNRTDTTVDPDGRPVRVDAWQVVAGTYLPNVTTTYGYAPFDLQNKIVDDLGNTTTMSYDVLGRRTTLVDPDRGTVSTSYYGTGEVHVETHEGTGNSSTHSYDDLGRKTRTEDHDHAANQNRVTTFSWDTATNGIGQLAEAVSPDNIKTGFRYDALGRPSGADYTIDSATSTYSTLIGYDGKGRVSTTAYPQVPGRARFTVQNTYNDYGFAADVLDVTPGQTATTLWHTTSRNADLALTGATMADNGAVTLTNTYHQQTGWLINRKAEKAATTLQDITYGYYENGLIYTRNQNDSTVTNRNETYHLDELGQLTRWQLAVNGVQKKDLSYSYDTIGNITPAGEERYYGNSNSSACTAGHAGPHALCWVDALDTTGINSYSYDGQGRETLDEHEDGSTRATTYTAFDLPKTITDGGVTTTFDYDAFGTRVRKSNPSGTTVYLPGLFEKRTTSGGATSYVFYVNGPAGPIGQAVYDGTGTTMEYVLTDALGSTGASLSATGAVTGSFHYEPFGRRTTVDGAPSGIPAGNVTHGFTGHEMDDGLGLINMAGRIYDPAKKALLTADPVLANHPYAYASNNPTSFIDPTGYDDFPIFGGNNSPGPTFGGIEGVEATNAESWEWVVGDTKFSCVGGENAYSCKGTASASKTPTGNVGSDESGYSAAADYSLEYSPGLNMMLNFDAFAEATGLNSFLDWWDTTIAEMPAGGVDNNHIGLGYTEQEQALMRPVTNGEFATQMAAALATVLIELRMMGSVAQTTTAGGASAGGMAGTGSAYGEAMLGLSEAEGITVQVVTRSRGTAMARISRGLLTFDGRTNGYKALVAMTNYNHLYPNTRWIVGVGTHGGMNGTWSGTQALRAVPGFDAAAALSGRAKNFATALSKLGMRNVEVFDLADEAGVAAFRTAEMGAVGQPNVMVLRAWCYSTLSCP